MSAKRQSEEPSGPFEERTVPIDALQENPRNPRNHPPEQIEKLIASIRRFGQRKSVLVRKANMMIIAGHGLCRAMREAGELEIACSLWDIDQRTADEFMLGESGRHRRRRRPGELSVDRLRP